MPQKKIILSTDFDDYSEDDLFAVHSPSEDFFLAYQLNKALGIQFKNATEIIDPNLKVPYFSRFIWEQSPGEPRWELIANHYVSSTQTANEYQLFNAAVEEKTSLIPHLSKVDFFIKTPKNTLSTDAIKAIQNLDEIQLIYPIKEPKIKQNPNLIFD